jgi:hypothetical protein
VGGDDAVIQLVTRCNSADEFIERFARYTTATDLVVPALPNITVGTAGPFVVCLKDRSVMLKGRCEVTEIRPVVLAPGAGTSGLALMRLHLREMDAHSAGVHLRLMERHASWSEPPARSAPAPEPAPSPSPVEAVPAETPPAADTSAVTVVNGETTAIAPLPRAEERAPGATFTLPANPLTDLDAADLASFIEHTLLESQGGKGAGDAAADAAFTDGPVETTSLVRAETRQERARRMGRRAGPFAAIAALGLALGIAIGAGGGGEAPVALAATTIVVPAPAPAPPPPSTPPVAEELPDGDPIPAARKNTKRIRSHRTRAKRSHRGRSQHRGGAVASR